jgi:hypothetical protein
MRVGRQVERWHSADGKHVLRVFRRDEQFYFVELSEMSEGKETYWTNTRTSENFDSLGAAREAALLLLPWLKEGMQQA